MGPRSQILSLILVLVGDFIVSIGKVFQGLAKENACRDMKIHDSLGAEELRALKRKKRDIVVMTMGSEA